MAEDRENDAGPIGMAKPRKAEEIITDRENLTETKLEDRGDTFRTPIRGINVDTTPPVTPTSHPKTDTDYGKEGENKESKATAGQSGKQDIGSKSRSERDESRSR